MARRDRAGQCLKRSEEEHVTGISGTAAGEAGGARGRGGATARRVRRRPAGRPCPARQADVQPVPLPRPGQAGPAAERVSLDVSAFARVIHVDPATRTAVVGGMTTYEDLCDATLPHGLMPLVVPAAQDDHAGRRGHRPRHRVDLALARPAARVGDRDAAPHRRRPGRHRHQGQRAQRPVLRLPELLRHARLLARPHHRADAGQAVRPPAALRLQRPEELHGRDRRDRARRQLPRAQGRLPRRGRVQQQPSCT